jgi:hypothetical protein
MSTAQHGKTPSNGKSHMKPVVSTCATLSSLFALSALSCAGAAAADVPRFYWKTLAGTQATPLIYESLSGNTNPFDPSHRVNPDAQIDVSLAMAGYALFLPVFDRSAMAAVILPMGRISSDTTVGAITTNASASGFGDPVIEFDINLIGPPAQKNIPDAIRYEPGFSLDLLVDLAIPIGEYENDSPVNIGQNRWYGRVGMPMIYQIGPWVPGRRMTLEAVPAMWWFTDNNDFVGQTLETDPAFQVDLHLTRDLSDHAWASLDTVWYSGSDSTLGGTSSEAHSNVGAGFTLGYEVNQNMQLTFGYKSTFNDDDDGEMRMDSFVLTLVYGSHPIIEGANRLKGE